MIKITNQNFCVHILQKILFFFSVCFSRCSSYYIKYSNLFYFQNNRKSKLSSLKRYLFKLLLFQCVDQYSQNLNFRYNVPREIFWIHIYSFKFLNLPSASCQKRDCCLLYIVNEKGQQMCQVFMNECKNRLLYVLAQSQFSNDLCFLNVFRKKIIEMFKR